MDRTILKRTTLDQHGRDSGVPNATPAERLMMVLALTLAAWAFKEPHIAQPRLQRHVDCTVRSGPPKDIADAVTLDRSDS